MGKSGFSNLEVDKLCLDNVLLEQHLGEGRIHPYTPLKDNSSLYAWTPNNCRHKINSELTFVGLYQRSQYSMFSFTAYNIRTCFGWLSSVWGLWRGGSRIPTPLTEGHIAPLALLAWLSWGRGNRHKPCLYALGLGWLFIDFKMRKMATEILSGVLG